jgi:hypothetical protein
VPLLLIMSICIFYAPYITYNIIVILGKMFIKYPIFSGLSKMMDGGVNLLYKDVTDGRTVSRSCLLAIGRNW